MKTNAEEINKLVLKTLLIQEVFCYSIFLGKFEI